MRVLATAFGALGALALAGSASSAQPVTFSGAGTFATAPGVAGLTAGAFTFAFTLPTSPTPTVSVPDQTFTLAGVGGLFRQGATTTAVTGDLFFFTRALGGLFDLDVGATTLLNPFDGPPLYVGATSAPRFVLGTWTPGDPVGLGVGAVTSASITTAATSVPEPGTLALAGLGGVALAGAAATRRRPSAERPVVR